MVDVGGVSADSSASADYGNDSTTAEHGDSDDGEYGVESGESPADTSEDYAADDTSDTAIVADEPAPAVTATTPTTAATTAATAATPAATTAATTTAATTAANPTVSVGSIGSSSYKTLNYSEVKGVWISYIELADMLTGRTREQFTAAIGEAYDNAVSLGLNTVYVHVRSHGDAYYDSELYPWSKYVSGSLGTAPDFDPLEIMISEAHSRGLSFQAWINPLRACAVSDIGGESGYPIYSWVNGSDTADRYVVRVGDYYYLNPAYEEVTDYIAAGAAEIVANYDVDGVHIDDYFYPTTDASFDSSAYAESGFSTISSFRLSNCDRLVSGIYKAVKSANPNALFGISCQGSIENNYNQMYADVEKWCTQGGYTDYIMPQIYYGFDNSSQPFAQCAAEWDALASSGGIPLIAGLSVSKIGLEDTWAGAGKNEWITDKNILERQYTELLKQQSYGGFCLYSYRSIFTPDSSVSAQVAQEIQALKTAINQ